MSQPMQFNNGLTNEQENEILTLKSAICDVKRRVEALGRHRNYSLTVTKLEEADLWLTNRMHVAA